MGSPAENRLTAMEEAIGHISGLLAFAIEGVARTGAFDQAKTQVPVIDLLEKLRATLDRLHLDAPDVILRGASAQVKNEPVHMKRLFER